MRYEHKEEIYIDWSRPKAVDCECVGTTQHLDLRPMDRADDYNYCWISAIPRDGYWGTTLLTDHVYCLGTSPLRIYFFAEVLCNFLHSRDASRQGHDHSLLLNGLYVRPIQGQRHFVRRVLTRYSRPRRRTCLLILYDILSRVRICPLVRNVNGITDLEIYIPESQLGRRRTVCHMRRHTLVKGTHAHQDQAIHARFPTRSYFRTTFFHKTSETG